LTTPLGDDEVMPKREHRQVPQRAIVGTDNAVRKKRNKIDKKKKIKSEVISSGSGRIGDLLNLGGFSSVADVSTNPNISAPASAPAGSRIMETQTVSISSAFDDLLGLQTPGPVASSVLGVESTTAELSNMAMSQTSPTKSSRKMWMKAALKTGSSDGPHLVDWNQVSLYYKLEHVSHGEQGVSVSVSVRVQNDMATAALNNLTLVFKSYGQFSLGTVGTRDSVEVKKLGPFAYDQIESSKELKGHLCTDGMNVPIKITLPASLYLIPTTGLTLETVMADLSNQHFTSASVKLELQKLGAAKVKPLLTSFFCASEVESNSGNLVATLAAQSRQGEKVRILIKIKESTVKIDIKSTNHTLCQALAADVKKLVF
jgi:hypothetical protein